MTDPDGNPKCLTKVRMPRGQGGRGDGRGAAPAHHPRPQINYGGDVPQHYYLCNHVRVQHDRQATVGRGSSLQVDNEILFPGCVLRWHGFPTHTHLGTVGRGLEPRQVAASGALSPAGGSLRRTEGTSASGVFLKTKMGSGSGPGEMTEVLASQRYNAHMVL